jgi:hypothetical protein
MLFLVHVKNIWSLQVYIATNNLMCIWSVLLWVSHFGWIAMKNFLYISSFYHVHKSDQILYYSTVKSNHVQIKVSKWHGLGLHNFTQLTKSVPWFVATEITKTNLRSMRNDKFSVCLLNFTIMLHCCCLYVCPSVP